MTRPNRHESLSRRRRFRERRDRVIEFAMEDVLPIVIGILLVLLLLGAVGIIPVDDGILTVRISECECPE